MTDNSVYVIKSVKEEKSDISLAKKLQMKLVLPFIDNNRLTVFS